MPPEVTTVVDPNDPANQNQDQNNSNTNNEDLTKLIQTTLGETERARQAAEQRNRELEDELNKLKNAQNAAPVVDKTQNSDPQEFWKNPIENISALVAAQVKPLAAFTQEMRIQQQYQQLKTQYRQYNGFDKIENLVDGFMQGMEPSHANMQVAIQRAAGHLALSGNWGNNNQSNQPPANNNEPGRIVGEINPNTPNQNRPVVDLQAHLRPSNRSTVDNKENLKPKRRPLTENENRIRKQMGNISEEKYWELMEAPVSVGEWKKEGK